MKGPTKLKKKILVENIKTISHGVVKAPYSVVYSVFAPQLVNLQTIFHPIVKVP